MNELMGPHFINVDLEIWSRTDLAALARALEPRSLILYAGRSRRKFLVAIEAKSSRLTSPERTMWSLLELIESLPPAARRSWKSAESRVFNVGYEGGEFVTLFHERPAGSGRWYPKDPGKAAQPCETSLSPDLLHAVARARGTITTTIYPPRREVATRRPRRGSSGRVD